MKTVTRIKTTAYEITKVGIDMLIFDEVYQRIRMNYEYQGFNCFLCHKSFDLGENISLIMVKGYPNKVVCHTCGMDIENDLNIAYERIGYERMKAKGCYC